MNDKPFQSMDDGELVGKYKLTGNLELLGVLYQRYMDLVFGVSMKYLKNRDLSKDAVMEIFESISQSLLRHEVQNFKSWLHVTTRNYCLMEIRKRKKSFPTENSQDIFMEIPDQVNHDNDMELEEDISKLEECIETLKDEQKVCIELFYLKSKSYQEIEQQTEYPLKKVKSHIQNGKRNLKICMES